MYLDDAPKPHTHTVSLIVAGYFIWKALALRSKASVTRLFASYLQMLMLVRQLALSGPLPFREV